MDDRVFISDGHWRKSLAAVRGLGRRGIPVTVGESTRLSAAAFSRYCRRAVVYPSVHFRPDDFIDYLCTDLSRNPCRMLLPMEDETCEVLARHSADIARLTYLPLVRHEVLRFARDKGNIIQLAEKLGIPVPRTWHIDRIEQIHALKDILPYPVVIKPRVSSGALGIRYPGTPAEFLEHYLAVHRNYPLPLVQEHIPRQGAGYGASFLFDEKGSVRASFVHKRLREYPVSGGASTLRESVRRDDIREMGLQLLKALNWFGVAMVEFKIDLRSNTPMLMEINPRFWGSLALAIEAGVNFPYLLYRMSRGEAFAPVEQYEVGKRCRWFLPGDFLHFVCNPQRMKLLPGFFNFHDRTVAHDIFASDDPLPVLGTVLTPLTFLYDPDMKRRLEERKQP